MRLPLDNLLRTSAIVWRDGSSSSVSRLLTSRLNKQSSNWTLILEISALISCSSLWVTFKDMKRFTRKLRSLSRWQTSEEQQTNKNKNEERRNWNGLFWIDLCGLYIWFSQYKPRDIHKRIFHLPFHNLCINKARAEDEIPEELFPWESSRGLYWENETYKLKSSILILIKKKNK